MGQKKTRKGVPIGYKSKQRKKKNKHEKNGIVFNSAKHRLIVKRTLSQVWARVGGR